MSLSAFFFFGLAMCFVESCFGAAVLCIVSELVNRLLGGRSARKPRGMARRRLENELAEFKRRKEASEQNEDLPEPETNPWSTPSGPLGQASPIESPGKQVVPVPRMGKAFVICFVVNLIQFFLRYIFAVSMTFVAGAGVAFDDFMMGMMGHVIQYDAVTPFIGFLILAVVLGKRLPTTWRIALAISALYFVFILGAIWFVVVVLTRF